MKKPKPAVLAVIICAICMGVVFLAYLIASLRKKEEPADADYLDDLDAPQIAEKEEKAHSKTRRGYIPIPLNR